MTNGFPYGEAERAAIRSGMTYEAFREEARRNGWPERSRHAWHQQRSVIATQGGGTSHRPFGADTGLDPDPGESPRATGSTGAARVPKDDLDEVFEHIEAAAERRDLLAEGAKQIAWHAPVDGPIGVAIFSDVHCGAGGVLYKRFRADVEVLRDAEGLYGVLNGDLLENAKPQEKSGNALYSSAFANPKEQLEYARRRMAIARGKWLLLTQGNHEARDYKHAGLDRLPDLCQELGIEYATEAGAEIRLTVGVQRYSLIVKHDYGGKSKINKSNAQRRAFEEWPWILDRVTADVVALAHLHEPDLHVTARRGHEVILLRSGSYKVADAWAEAAGYKPAYGVPVLVFAPDEHRIVPFADFETGVRFLAQERRRWQRR